ncbi:MAG: DUF6789 family protein [Chthoniobacterales bacterium]
MKAPKLLPSLLGLICGVCATGPMSAVMIALHRRLPQSEKYPLPPREITEKITTDMPLTPPTRSAVAWLAHFGYGGAAGVLYANAKVPIAPAPRGLIFGMLVWLTSYFGLLPALGILSPAEKHPVRRSGLMIVAHLVWGWLLAMLLDTFLNDRRETEAAFHTSPRASQDAS